MNGINRKLLVFNQRKTISREQDMRTLHQKLQEDAGEYYRREVREEVGFRGCIHPFDISKRIFMNNLCLNLRLLNVSRDQDMRTLDQVCWIKNYTRMLGSMAGEK